MARISELHNRKRDRLACISAGWLFYCCIYLLYKVSRTTLKQVLLASEMIGKGLKFSAIVGVLSVVSIAPSWAVSSVDVATRSSLISSHSTSELLIQRQQYSSALDKLQQGDKKGFSQLKDRLRSYPLHPYLEYADLKSRIRSVQRAEVDQFLVRYADHFLAGYTRGIWLHELARRNHWQNYLTYYDGRKNKTLSCHAVNAAVQVRKQSETELVDLVKQKWLVSFSQPKACDPAFAWLKKQIKIDNELRWQRTALALDKRNWKLARALGKKLTGTRAKQYQAWPTIRRSPQKILSKAYSANTEQHRKLALYTVSKVLAEDLVKAEELWEKLKARYSFSDEQRYKLERKLAIRSAQRHYDDALARLEALPGQAVNARVREWRVRAALRTQDWKGAYKHLLNMLPEEQIQDQWVYWRGRVEQQIGNGHVAKLAYQRLADKRGYYSFLAAERLGSSYAFTPDSPQVELQTLNALALTPAFMRVRELLEHEQLNYARVEWARATKSLDDKRLMAAGLLAHRWQWHEQAIRIASRLERYDDLDLRFATPHRQQVERYAQAVNIDPNWAQAIMRRESAYAADARSGVGARGLMQLMPATARHVARKQGWKWQGVNKLNLPETNIRYGTAYLAELSDELKEIPLVTAAYNAGPHRVRKWLPEHGALPLDIWIDTIPFDETRKYVHAVSEYMSIFKWRSAGQPIQSTQALLYTQKQVGGAVLASNHSQPKSGI